MEWFKQIEKIIPRMPIFVAIPCKEIGAELSTGRHRSALFSICEATEALVRFLAIASSCEVIAKNEGVAPNWLSRQAASVFDSPTFGALVVLLDTIVNKADLEHLHELSNSWGYIKPQLFGSAPEKEMRERHNLVALRNPLAHGTGVSDKLAGELLELWGPRFADAIVHLDWMREIEIWAQDADLGLILLRGVKPTIGRMPVPPATSIALGEVMMGRGGSPVPLVPLAFHRSWQDGSSPVPQLFVNTGSIGLLYSMFGPADALQVEGSSKERERFETCSISLGSGERSSNVRS